MPATDCFKVTTIPGNPTEIGLATLELSSDG